MINKLDNMEEMEKFLEPNLPRTNHEEIKKSRLVEITNETIWS